MQNIRRDLLISKLKTFARQQNIIQLGRACTKFTNSNPWPTKDISICHIRRKKMLQVRTQLQIIIKPGIKKLKILDKFSKVIKKMKTVNRVFLDVQRTTINIYIHMYIYIYCNALELMAFQSESQRNEQVSKL